MNACKSGMPNGTCHAWEIVQVPVSISYKESLINLYKGTSIHKGDYVGAHTILLGEHMPEGPCLLRVKIFFGGISSFVSLCVSLLALLYLSNQVYPDV